MLLDRLDYVMEHSGIGHVGAWTAPTSGVRSRRREAVQRNFWFCTIDDPSTCGVRDRIGVDHIMVEVDYPHADSTWPDTQALLAQRSRRAAHGRRGRKLTHENASRLFRHPVPPEGFVPPVG